MESAETIRNYMLKNRLLKESQQISDDDSLLETGIIDSLAIFEITTFIEQEFGISVGEDDLVPENFDSLAAMGRFVESRR